ncbi:CatB-related O-acetyltransferase [Candidatus Trichorickettsia mobilis]|uniref:CatB-related O-acetyltransferase n=1 Tax=Candidatus Trichorickettsia mobilis TaxID=1346319 RepID=UPI0029318363|nr:CatB-related O-acetyltransferase [Candidatus Trichorickettsia mobilis]
MVNPDIHYPHTYLKTVKETVFLKHFVHNPNIEIGDYTYYHDLNNPEDFEYKNVRGAFYVKLIIGKFGQIAMNTIFILSEMNHHMHGFTTYPFFLFEQWDQYAPEIGLKGNTEVGNDVWFGTNAVIMPGVRIGDGAIIGAYAVVTKDVAPYSVVAGNPARVVKQRFSDAIIADLLEIQWWNWDYDKITRNVNLIVGGDIKKLKVAI